jgi:CBS domain containing-hemolysin-like protein
MSVVILLVLMNAFFVAAEYALVKVRISRITQLISEGVYRARFVKTITSNIDTYLSACQLGITLASLALGWKGQEYTEKLITSFFFNLLPEPTIKVISYVIAFAIITILHIVIGELCPKSMAIQKAESMALWLAPPLTLFYKITYPAIWFLNHMSSSILKFLGVKPLSEHEQAHTEEEIRILVNESEKSGIIDQEERALFDNVFEFSERVAREAMVPRTSMVVLYTEDTFEENLKVVAETKHTRYPVAEDDKDNIIGFIHVTDLYAEASKQGNSQIQNITRNILRVPEFMELSQVLQLMKKNRTQIAIVQEEYGGTAGIITLEDILEEIVGEIQDEFDNKRPVYEQIENGYSIDGRLLIQDVNNILNLNISNEDVDTIGGWIHMMIETDPEVGKIFVHENVSFEIEEVDKNRIVRLIAKIIPSVSLNIIEES